MTGPNPLDELGERAQALGEFIREQRRVARLSLRKLGELANVSNPYLSQIERGLRKPSAEILQQLAKGLRISAETLYVQAGILEERDDAPTLERAIWRDSSLSQSQKSALVQVLRSFRSENGGAGTAATTKPVHDPDNSDDRDGIDDPDRTDRTGSAQDRTGDNGTASDDRTTGDRSAGAGAAVSAVSAVSRAARVTKGSVKARKSVKQPGVRSP